MELLGPRNALLISKAVRTMGGVDANLIFSFIYEDLYCDETDEIQAFLEWIVAMRYGITEDSLGESFQEYKRFLETKEIVGKL